MKRFWIPGAVALLALSGFTAGCDTDDDDDKGAQTTTSAAVTQNDEDDETSDDAGAGWETVTDPVEHAFTIDLPKGWKNDAYLNRSGVFTTNVATSESPDGAAALFYGDPKLRPFVEPKSAWPGQEKDPNVRIQAYTPAEDYVPAYLKSRFGTLPGFRIINVSSEPQLVEKNRAVAQKQGVNLNALHSARVDFEFTQNGAVRHGAIYGSTFSMGIVWFSSVAGIVSNDDPLRYKANLFHILESQKADPAWKEKERVAAADRQRQHEYVMGQIARNTEQLRINHQNNMATLAGMAARHQLRMDAIHAAGDASMAAYRARDTASDNNQRGFLNYITDQNTVSTSGGQTFQVDNQYERYYVNKNDHSYIGLKGGANLNNLNGVNPADYEEAKIIR